MADTSDSEVTQQFMETTGAEANVAKFFIERCHFKNSSSKPFLHLPDSSCTKFLPSVHFLSHGAHSGELSGQGAAV